MRVVGFVQRKDTGRPEAVHGRPCRPSDIEHEVRVADVAVHYRGRPFSRDARVGRTEADGLLIHDGRRCYVEVDNTGHMDRKQMNAKWQRYSSGAIDGFILVVCRTDARMERLRAGAGPVRDHALFTTFDRLRAGRPWTDWYGKTVVI